MKKLLFVSLLAASLWLIACDDDSTTENNTNNSDPCATVECPEMATCVVSGEVGECLCDAPYILEEGACINEKSVDCLDVAPANAESEVITVTITYDATSGWDEPAPCDWTCLEGYVQDATACIEESFDPPLDGFGTITGECGVIDATHLTSTSPFFFLNTIDFAQDTYDASDFDLLSEGGQVLATTENAGGSSAWSEVFSYEVLYRCEFADIDQTETKKR